jgi:hypothetical protein
MLHFVIQRRASQRRAAGLMVVLRRYDEETWSGKVYCELKDEEFRKDVRTQSIWDDLDSGTWNRSLPGLPDDSTCYRSIALRDQCGRLALVAWPRRDGSCQHFF